MINRERVSKAAYTRCRRGGSCGFAISIGGLWVGCDLNKLQLGIEAGEAVSKLIAAYFVIKLMFKIPKWFGLSNYVEKAENVQSAAVILYAQVLSIIPRLMMLILHHMLLRLQ